MYCNGKEAWNMSLMSLSSKLNAQTKHYKMKTAIATVFEILPPFEVRMHKEIWAKMCAIIMQQTIFPNNFHISTALLYHLIRIAIDILFRAHKRLTAIIQFFLFLTYLISFRCAFVLLSVCAFEIKWRHCI